MRYFLLPVLIFAAAVSSAQPGMSARELFQSMMSGMDKVKTCSYVLNMDERVFGKMAHGELIAKVNTKPFKAYVYSINPNPGAEALYVENSNNGKVLINPNK